MAVNSRPTKARALGSAIRAAREETSGLSLRKFAAQLGKDPGLMSRWETGERTPKATDVAQILTALGISGERYDQILSMTEGADDAAWLAISLPEQRLQMDALLKFEAAAALITEVSPLLIPGLLQTGDYVRAIMAAGTVPPGEVASRVAVRLGRRTTVTEAGVPFLGYVGESALRQIIGDHTVMLGQLRHLATVANQDKVDVRVLPFNSGWHPALEGAFTLITSTEEPPIVHIENRRSGLFLHEPDDIDAYREAVDVLEEKAMNPTRSAELIAEIITELETT